MVDVEAGWPDLLSGASEDACVADAEFLLHQVAVTDAAIAALTARRNHAAWRLARNPLMARRRVTPHDPELGRWVSDERVAGFEIAARLGISGKTATGWASTGAALYTRLPGTGVALAVGAISPSKAEAIVRAAGDVDWQTGELIEAEVLARAGQRTPTQLARDVADAAIRLDPGEALRRREVAMRQRSVCRPRPLADGMAWLSATLPAEHAADIWATIDTAARSLKAKGDPRLLPHLRADALHTYLTTPPAPAGSERAASAPQPTPPPTASATGTAMTPRGTASATRPAAAGLVSTPSAGPAPMQLGTTPPVPTPPGTLAPLRTAMADPDPTPTATPPAPRTATAPSVPTPTPTPTPMRAVSPAPELTPVPAHGIERGRSPDGDPALGSGGARDVGEIPSRVHAEVGIVVPLDVALGRAETPGLLTGHGPVTAQAVRDILALSSTRIRVLVSQTDGREPLTSQLGKTIAITPATYRVPATLRRLITASQPTCANMTCSNPTRSADIDHEHEFAHGGTTTRGNLRALCRWCHAMKTFAHVRFATTPTGHPSVTTPLGHTYADTPPPF